MANRIKAFNQFVQFVEIPEPTPEERRLDQLFYNSTKWKKVRAMKLRMNPICECTENCGKLAEEVHHVIDRKDRPDLAYDLENLQSLTKSCHSKITFARIKEKK